MNWLAPLSQRQLGLIVIGCRWPASQSMDMQAVVTNPADMDYGLKRFVADVVIGDMVQIGGRSDAIGHFAAALRASLERLAKSLRMWGTKVGSISHVHIPFGRCDWRRSPEGNIAAGMAAVNFMRLKNAP